MTIIILNGRLGNNMFQIAFGEMLSYYHGAKVLFVPKSRNTGNLKYFKKLSNSKLFFLPFNLLFLFKIFSKTSVYKTVIQENQFDTFLPAKEFSNVILSGYFQYTEYITKLKSHWSEFFTINPEFVQEFKADYNRYFGQNRVLTIHVRLGDYLSVNFKAVSSTAFVGWDWYKKALSNLNLDDFDTIFLISDEPSKAKDGLNLNVRNLVFSDGKEITDLQLLMNTDVAIISNSSFAWWGAFLNIKPQKQVYAPNNWIGYKEGIEFPTGIMIEEFIWVE
tara:strand:+ start:317 stop:1147 length:831 start_codon:yes stop_codon:yes gene_type:complete